MSRILTITLCALMLSAPALAQTAPEQRKISAEKPIGEGDPNATTCYRPSSSFSHITQLECKPNSEWARIHAADNHSFVIDTGKMAAAPLNIEHH